MIKRIIIIFILIMIFIISNSYATDEIIESQMEALDLSSFISQGKEYTKEVFPEIDLQEFLNSSLSGNIDNNNIFKGVLSIFSNEIFSTIKILGSILVIIIIHSILKSISENVSNEGVLQVAYYVQYILIVTVIMSNFSEILNTVKDSIYNLTGFINTLVPILLALVTATRKYSF